MKKIFTLVISSFITLSLLAFDGSRLSVSTFSNKNNVVVEVDGRKYDLKDNSITLNNLAEGRHNVMVIETGSKGVFNRRENTLYSSAVFLKRGYHLDITINRFGKALVEEGRIDSRDYNDKNNDYNKDDRKSGGWNNGYGNVMSNREFDNVKSQIKKEWLESNRLVSVKTVVDKSNFTSQQVKELMLLFTFENNRLEVAKYAYTKTVDTQNYFVVNDAFTFGSSKDDLARFIRTKEIGNRR